MPSSWAKANTLWQDAPVTSTPILAAKLQHIDDGVYDLKQLTWKLSYDEPTNVITAASGLRANAFFVGAAALASTHLADTANLIRITDTLRVTGGMIANSTIGGGKIANSIAIPGTPTIGTDPAADDQTLRVPSTQWVRTAIASYAPGGGSGSIADNSVTNVKLFDKTITNAKIADGTIVETLFPASMVDGSAVTASLRTLGTGATQAAAGNDPRFSGSGVPADGSVTDAKVAAGAAIAWAKISKTGSSLADLTTRSAADLSTGTLADARLSSNIHRLDTASTITGNPFIIGSTTNFRFQFGVSPTRALMGLNSANAASSAGMKRMNFMVLEADTQPVISIQVDGTPQILFGAGGTTAPDANLYRGGVNTLQTDDAFVATSLTALTGDVILAASKAFLARQGSVGTSIAQAVRLAADSNDRYIVQSDGKNIWGDGTVTDTTLYRGAADQLTTDDQFRSVRTNLTDVALAVQKSGDAQARSYIEASGKQWWGDGTGWDTNQYRVAADVLATDDELRSIRASAATASISTVVVADTVTRFQISAGGTIEWGTGAAARDTNLYRSGAGALKTDGSFTSVGTVLAANGGISIGAVGPAAQMGVLISADVNLYRSAADILKTDDSIQSVGGYTSNVGLATQTRIGAVGPGGEAAIDFGSAGDAKVWRVAGGQVGIQSVLLTQTSFSPIVYQPAGNANPIFYVSTAGALNFGPGGGTPTDFTVSRSGAGQADMGAAGALLRVGGSMGTTTAGTGGVITKTFPVYDIRAWGAVGGGADDRAAIQAAITQAAAVGGVVYIPRGVWTVGTPGLTIPSNVSIVGAHGGFANTTSGSILTQIGGYTGAIFTMSPGVGCLFERFQIYNQGVHAVVVTGATQFVNSTFRHVVFVNFGTGHSCYLNSSAGVGNERILWDRCYFTGGGVNQYHICSIGPDFFDKMTVRDCVFESFQGYAVYVRGVVRSFAMRDNVVHGLAGSGCRGTLYIDNGGGTGFTYGVEIDRHYTEATADRGVTTDVTHQGDFVFKGTLTYVTFVSGMVNSPSGFAPGSANAVNIQATSGKVSLVNANAFGAIVDPNNLKSIV